ncbi:MAG: hypothetical protein ACYCS1_07885 [Gammaproteobacteria bacterium]
MSAKNLCIRLGPTERAALAALPGDSDSERIRRLILDRSIVDHLEERLATRVALAVAVDGGKTRSQVSRLSKLFVGYLEIMASSMPAANQALADQIRELTEGSKDV